MQSRSGHRPERDGRRGAVVQRRRPQHGLDFHGGRRGERFPQASCVQHPRQLETSNYLRASVNNAFRNIFIAAAKWFVSVIVLLGCYAPVALAADAPPAIPIEE